jgi:hypothetical protein
VPERVAVVLALAGVEVRNFYPAAKQERSGKLVQTATGRKPVVESSSLPTRSQ